MKMKAQLRNRLLSALLFVVMLLNYLTMTSLTTFVSGEGYAYDGGAGTKVSDPDTSAKYPEFLGDNASTECAGRIWTDKSVYTADVTFDVPGGGKSTIKLNADRNGEDFLVAYSALATAESISGQTQVPVDVVFIIDISGSMSNASSNMDNGKSRIYNTVQATNKAIDELMSLNDYTRVAVAVFSSTAKILLPLDRYTKTSDNVPYFSLNRDKGSDEYDTTLYTRAVNSSGTTVSGSTAVSGGTNIQVGLYEGMNILAGITKEDTKVNIHGQIIPRVPSVILLSDGCPTYSSDSQAWWAPSNNNNDGSGNTVYAGNGMKAILVGSYMKAAIDRNYDVENTSYATTVYTIGMGISGLSGDSKDLSDITLNPGVSLNAPGISNYMKSAIKNYWSQYIQGNKTDIQVDRKKYYTLTHPTQNDVSFTDGYNYVDSHYDADNSFSVSKVFNNIVSSISISAPQVPTAIKGTDPVTDGYITYTDPIGEYMEVKDVKAIIYAGQTFVLKNTVSSGKTITYVFSGTVISPIYGERQISDIIINVEENNGKQTLVIKIPASVIPLRLNEVTLNSDGSVKAHTNNGAMPMRIVYSVGLRSGITKESDDGTVYIDKSELSAEYLAANTNEDGTINFYSNLYTGNYIVNGSSAGDTTAEFEPSNMNKFYNVFEDAPIYKDEQCTEQITAAEGLDDDAVYYLKYIFYHGINVKTNIVECTGAQLKTTGIKADSNGCIYIAKGSVRLNLVLLSESTKTLNQTDTANDFYAPEYTYNSVSNSDYGRKITVHHGNNGRISVTAGGDLKISKTVTADSDISVPDKTFEFTVSLEGDGSTSGEYNYIIVDAAGKTVSNGTFSANNPKIYIKGGQSATIFGLQPDAKYTVTEAEANKDGFNTSSVGSTGTIKAGKTSVVSFLNSYSVTPVTWPADNGIIGTKVLSGRPWTESDSFTFVFSAFDNSNSPLPENAVVTVDKDDTTDGQTAKFSFGQICFTAPGIYAYTVSESAPEAELPGMSYSGALYRITVAVKDNGKGSLEVEYCEIQKMYDDDAVKLFTYDEGGHTVMNSGEEADDEIIFTNVYSAQSVTYVPSAIKEYIDNSGHMPLVSGMFSFKLESVGIVENGSVVGNSASEVPMPEGSTNGCIVTANEGANITFPSIVFNQNCIPDGASSITFRYKMSEVTPESPVNGMTYDDSIHTFDIVVSIDADSNILNVSVYCLGRQQSITFTNEYTPEHVSADINGKKTFNGRDMNDGEVFEFILTPDSEAQSAIENGFLSVPAYITSVSGARDGVAKSFAFKDIRFRKAGTYVFYVCEVTGNSSSIIYDNSSITVTVVVDDADKDGNLEVKSVTYGNDKDTAEFTNTYISTFSGNPISLTGTKNLTGKTLLGGEFHFNVEEYRNGTFTKSRLVSHTPDEFPDSGVCSGTITFLKEETYDKAGVFEYYIEEQIPDNKGVGIYYDESRFRFTVTVEDDLNGNLKVTSTKLEKLSDTCWEPADAIEFNNKYVPIPTEVKFPLINKVIDGDRKEPLKSGEFTFEIKILSASPEDGIKLPSETTVSNEANGNIIFDNITFTKAGSYTVAVREVIPDDADKIPGITYSSSTITAVYTVTDDNNGNLTATITQFIGGEVITNVYSPSPVSVTLNAIKQLTGRDLREGEFTFILYDGDDKEIASASNDANGNADFKLNFDKAGTYTYTVSEKNDSLPGITYDTKVYTVIVTVVDVDGQLVADSVVYKLGNETVKGATFSNSYKPSSAAVSIDAIKNLIGRELKDGEFGFEVRDSEGNPVTFATNDENGIIVFDEIYLNSEGNYTFTVCEVIGSLEDVTYDKTEYFVMVTVTDDGNGKLTRYVSVFKGSDRTASVDKIVFENTCNLPEKPPATGDGAYSWIALLLISGGVITAIMSYDKKRKIK